MRIAVIGGGAAGMMAALTAAKYDQEAQVTLFERNETLGKKVMISGGGRCNVTTGNTDLKATLQNYPRGARFLKHAFYEFTPTMLYEWIESYGVPLKIEQDLRVFPKSNQGSDIVRLFERELSRANVQIKLTTKVCSITKLESGFIIDYEQQRSPETAQFDRVIITTGGQAYQHTGSVGDGYGFAEALGHKITDRAPSLNSYACSEKFCPDLAGISFKTVGLSFLGTKKYQFKGPMIFTHKGVSGPAVFALSALAAYEEVTETNPQQLKIDFVLKYNQSELLADLVSKIEDTPQKQISSIISSYIPKRLAVLLLYRLKIDSKKRAAEVSKKDRNRIIDYLKNFPLTLTRKTPGDEFVTAGGIDLNELNKKTMESKICPGLFLAGEILDIDGFTGGYNLHAAWATGRLAGRSAGLI